MAHADDDALAQARHAVESSDYLGARTALETALASGTASPGDLAEIYKLTGIVDGALGDAAGATAAFARWLALDSKAALPAGTSPKIVRPFTDASDKAKRRDTLKVKTETAVDPPSVTLVIVSDPLHLIARARVVVSADGKAEQTLEGAGKDRITIALPHGKRLDLRVQALDDHGNRVVELGSADVPIVITGADRGATGPAKGDGEGDVAQRKPDHHEHEGARTEALAHERPLYLRWWLWGGVTLALAGGSSYFGLQARSETDQLNKLNPPLHAFTDATALEASARRDVLLFNIGMISTGVFAIGTTLLYLTAPHVVRETRITAVPTRAGGAIVIGGTF